MSAAIQDCILWLGVCPFDVPLTPNSHLKRKTHINNNDILRRLRYSFDFSDSKMAAIFAEADQTVSRAEVSGWLKKDDDPDQLSCEDRTLACFLNGLINEMRGKRDGPPPVTEESLTNNVIFMKLKIALNLKSDDVLRILELADFAMSKHELSAFFRKPGHKHYRECKEQILRNFLHGVQLEYREDKDSESKWKSN